MKVDKNKSNIGCDISQNEHFISQLTFDARLQAIVKNLPFHRYPTDALYKEVEKLAAQLYKEKAENVLLCNGSDEGIFLLMERFGIPKRKSPILLLRPTFSMYTHYANALAIPTIESALDETMYPNVDEIIRLIAKEKPSIVFLPSPLAPTGRLIKKEDMLRIIEARQETIAVIDEAYVEFSTGKSMSNYIKKYSNLVVLRTLSKFYGMAGLRIGFILSRYRDELRKTQSPYAVSAINARMAAYGLASILKKDYRELKEKNASSRSELLSALRKCSFVKRMSDSDASFVYIETEAHAELYAFLLQGGFKIRSLHPVCPEGLRIGIASPSQNRSLIRLIERFSKRF